MTGNYVREVVDAKEALTVVSNQLNPHFGNVKLTDISVQTKMKSSLQNYIQIIFDAFQQSPKAHHLKVEGNIASLGTLLSQDVLMICAEIAKRLDTFEQDFSGSGEDH